MPDTSFPTLDVTTLVEPGELEQKLPLSSWAEEMQQEELGRTRAAARWAKQYDPQSYARAAEIAPGVPPEVGVRQLGVLEDAAKLAEYQKVFDKAPQMRGFFAERPKDLAFANPDELDNLSGIGWATEAFPQAVVQGWEQASGQYAGFRVLSGEATPEEAAQFDAYRQAEWRNFGARDGWFSQGLVGLGQSLPAMGMALAGGAAKAIQYGAIGGLMGLPAGPAGVATGMAAGAKIGGIAGSYQQNFRLLSGQAYAEFLDFRDEEGNPLDPQVARWAGLLAGASGAGMEQLGLAATLGQIPGVDRILGQFTVPGLKQMLSNKPMRQAFTNFVVNLGSAVSLETLTEVGQEGFQILAGELAKYADEGEFEPISGEEAIGRLTDAGVAALQVMTLLGPLASGTRLGADLLAASQSARDHEQLAQVRQTLEGNQLVERAPELARELIDKQTSGKELYIDAQQAQQLFQEQGLDLYGPPLLNWRERVQEALSTGGDIKVTVGEFATYLNRERDNPLLALVRTDPRGYTAEEIQLVREAQETLLQNDLQRAQAVSAEAPTRRAEAQPIEVFPELEELRKQIQRVGFAPQAVDQYTTMLGAFFNTMATRTGQSPSELFQQFSLEVMRAPLTNGTEVSPTSDTFFQSFYRGMSLEEFESLTQGVYEFKPDQFGMFIARRANDSRYYTNQPGSGLAELTLPDDLKVLDRESAEYTNLVNEFGLPSSRARNVIQYIYPSSFREFLLGKGYQAVRGKSAAIGHEEFLLLDPKLISAVSSSDLGGPTQANVDEFSMLFQGGETPRGAITFNENAALIRLFDGHDMSTLLHEAGHFFLNTLRATASASPDLQADWDLIRSKLKIGEDGKITREQHEQFAKWAEAYFMEGKAPTPELRSVFQAFQRWLKTLYRNLRRLGGKVSPEIRGVFDRMLASEARLEELAADSAYAPLFDSAEAMGVTPEEYLEYQKLVEDLKVDASESVRRRIVGQVARQSKGWRGEIQKKLARETEERLKDQAPYKWFAKLADGSIALNINGLKEAGYSTELIKRLPRRGVTANGLDPQIVAELFGYPTADEMMHDFSQAAPIKEAARQLAEKEMQNRFEADFDNGEIADLAIQQQMAQEGRLTLLATEYKALSSRAGREFDEAGPRQLAKQIAKDALYRKKVKDVSISQTQAAVNRAARMSESAMLKGDWTLAADWKRKQLLAQAIANEAAVLDTAIQKIRDKAARYSRTASKTIDPSAMEQIRALVEQYEFTKVSKKKLAKRQSLRDFLDAAAADGQVPIDIPDRLLREVGRVNYKELLVEDLLGLGDTLDNLEHLGRTKHRLKTLKKQREWAELKGQALDQLKQLKSRGKAIRKYTEEQGSAAKVAAGFFGSLLKPEKIFEWLDDADVRGFFNQNVFELIAQAQVMRDDLNAEFNKKIMDIFNEVPKGYLAEIIHVQGLPDQKFTRENLYAIALNSGNASNRKKLLEGELLDEAGLSEILSHLTTEDMDRVQKVWKTLDQLWPKIEALEKRLTGVAPPRIEPLAFAFKGKRYEGGYYPVVYDFKSRRGMNLIDDTTPQDKQVTVDQLFQNPAHMTPGTSHKHTVKRTKAAKPLARELSVLPGHIHQVIHDLAYREAIRSAYKILWDPDIRNEIIRVEGEQAYQQLQHWLRGVAREYAPEVDPVAQIASHFRTGTTMIAMGYRLTTAAAQLLGFGNVVKRVGPRYLANAIVKGTRHPIDTVNMVNHMSGELRHRFNQQDRDIRAATKDLVFGRSKLETIRLYAFAHIGALDKYVSSVAWIGAYQEYLDKHPGTDPDFARQHADRVVRLTQGSGQTKDLVKIANNGELLRWFTMFYSAFSAIHNEILDLTRQSVDDINRGDYRTLLTTRAGHWAAVVLAPAILGALVSGQGPEEDENVAWWATKQVMIYPTVGIPFVRDIVSSIESGFDYKLSPVQRFGVDTVKAAEKIWEGEFASSLKPLIHALGVAFRIPGVGQAYNTGEALVKGQQQNDLEAKDLIYGRQGR